MPQASAQPAQATLDVVLETNNAADKQAVPLFDEPTHPPVKLSPDKSKLIRLDQIVDKVIVGNDNHLAVLPSDKNTVVLVGRQPGATYFTALDDKGNIIMQRHVFVAAPQENYVRIRRTCAASELDNCRATEVYYCPDTCHNVALTAEDNTGGNTAASTAPQQGSADAIPPAPPNAIDSASE